MSGLPFHHLQARACWLRCHHHQTALTAQDAVTLATLEQSDGVNAPRPTQAERQAWWDAHGAGLLRTDPVMCLEPPRAFLAAPGQRLRLLDERGEHPWPHAPQKDGPSGAPGATRFDLDTPAQPPEPLRPRALARDPWHGVWALGEDRVWLLDPTLSRALASVAAPPEAWRDLAAWHGHLYLLPTTGQALWHHAPSGGWRRREVALPPSAIPCGVSAQDGVVVSVWRDGDGSGGWIVRLTQEGEVWIDDALGLEDPADVLCVGHGEVLIAELSARWGRRMRWVLARWHEGSWQHLHTHQLKGFDGRAVVWGRDAQGALRLWGTTAQGLRELYRVRERYVTRGVFESYMLDSRRPGCTWHRVYVDGCVPEETRVEVWAKTSEEVPVDMVLPRPPAGTTLAAVYAPQVPLGSRTLPGQVPEDAVDWDGWVSVGALDRRAAYEDLPMKPRGHEVVDTMEGLLKNKPGRYLWLRLVLHGKRKRAPSVRGVRVSYPRPSLLSLLPAYWRQDPEMARSMEQTLALFEAELSEQGARVGAFGHHLDPRQAPTEALEWLSRLVAFALDTRLTQRARRGLLQHAIALYRRRGTVPGLIQLCELITGAPTHIVEGFRTRPAGADVLGADTALLYLDGQGEARDLARWAHRFRVVLHAHPRGEQAALVEEAIEAFKPAHTIHEVCWLSGGARLGVDAAVGLRLELAACPERGQPAVLGQEMILGPRATLSFAPQTPEPQLPGALGQTTRLS